jgi:hypothetical protein
MKFQKLDQVKIYPTEKGISESWYVNIMSCYSQCRKNKPSRQIGQTSSSSGLSSRVPFLHDSNSPTFGDCGPSVLILMFDFSESINGSEISVMRG